MVKNKDGAGDNAYHGILDEWAREQQQAAAAHAREGDKTAEEGDNEERGHKIGTRIELTHEERRQLAEAIAGLTGYYMGRGPQEVTLPDGTTAYVHRFVTTEEYIARLERENAALREIVQAVAAIREWYGDPHAPFDAQISLLTITKARALLAGKRKEGEGCIRSS